MQQSTTANQAAEAAVWRSPASGSYPFTGAAHRTGTGTYNSSGSFLRFENADYSKKCTGTVDGALSCV
jgi:hypothetical protein